MYIISRKHLTSIHDSVVAFERKRNEQIEKPHGEQMENSVKQTGYCGSTNASEADGAGSDDKVVSGTGKSQMKRFTECCDNLCPS